MKLIRHRCNTVQALRDCPTHWGVEVDVRSRGKQLLVAHEPYVDGPAFEEWLNDYRHDTLIINMKEEGLEPHLIELMQQRGIENYFFLEQSFPFLVRWAKKGHSRSAVRVSEHESVETALKLAGIVQWVWVDGFTHFPLTSADAQRLQSAGFRLCLVSPEMHGRDAQRSVPALRQLLTELDIRADAVCSDRPDLWQ